MTKKFFYNRVYNTKRTIINLVIIGVCIIGVIVCFIITSNFQGENHNTPGTLNIKDDVTIEVNEHFTKEIFFSKIENVNLNTVDVIYPDDFDSSKVGTYDIIIKINNKNHDSKLTIVDTQKPELAVKQYTIKENESYTVNDFVQNCFDNSSVKCILSFYDGIDEDGNLINYANYTAEGTYAIKISAKDESGNENVQETKLIVEKEKSTDPVNPTPDPEKPVTCKYGNNEYETTNYLLTVDVTTNKCAVSLDLYKDANMTEAINKIMATETTRIKKDIEALNLTGTLALNRKVTAVINTSGDGIVGYELKIAVKISNDDKSETVVEYKLDGNGKREFIANPYNLEK